MPAVLPTRFGAYVDLMPIRSRGAFQFVAAKRESDGRPVVLALAGPRADRSLVRDAFREAARVTALLDHPRIARVEAGGDTDGAPYLSFDCAAVADGLDVVRVIADAEEKIPYGAADAFIAGLRETLVAAHAVTDPLRGGPVCLGRFSAGNVLFDADGSWKLVGFGRNLAIEKDNGAVDGESAFCAAPELASGAAASPSGDYVALILFSRTVLPYVDMSGAVGRLLRGEPAPGDDELMELLRWVEQRVVGELPPHRASIAEAVAVADRIRGFMESPLDPAGFERFVARLLERDREPTPLTEPVDAGPRTLVLGPDASWIAGPTGERHRLGPAHRRLVLALAARHRATNAPPLTVWELLAAGWPGESPLPEAGANRVYVAVNRLRRLGLREVIERFDDGYRLAPRTVLVDHA